MGALGDGVGPDLDHAIRLCQLLGLDPDETSDISIRIVAGVGAVAEWSGARRVPLARIASAFADVFDDPDPAPVPAAGDAEKWQIGPDPWAAPHSWAPDEPCPCGQPSTCPATPPAEAEVIEAARLVAHSLLTMRNEGAIMLGADWPEAQGLIDALAGMDEPPC